MYYFVTGSLSQIQGDNGVSSHPTDTLYKVASNVVKDMMRSSVTASNKSVLDEIRRILNCWNNDFLRLPLEDCDILSQRIVTTPDMVKSYITFADFLFSG